MKRINLVYWIATGIIILLIGLGSFGDIFMLEPMREASEQQGFPLHFMPFFGLVKLLAVVVIVVPAFKSLKLAAYVGLFWYFLGAIYSHIMVGDGVSMTMGAVVAFAAVLVSFFAWRKMEMAKA